MPDSVDLEAAIAEAAALPKSATGDNGSATQHDLSQLIQADRYLANKRRKGPGFTLSKVVAGGAR
jgi:hypothetical protein